MQTLDNIDELLVAWEKNKDCAIPVPCTLSEALEFTKLKQMLTELSHQIHDSRIKNDLVTEESSIKNFCDTYRIFSKEYVYRVLKSG